MGTPAKTKFGNMEIPCEILLLMFIFELVKIFSATSPEVVVGLSETGICKRIGRLVIGLHGILAPLSMVVRNEMVGASENFLSVERFSASGNQLSELFSVFCPRDIAMGRVPAPTVGIACLWSFCDTPIAVFGGDGDPAESVSPVVEA